MRARWATGAAVVLALLAGCGGDDDTAASPTTLLPPRGPATDAPTTTTTVGVDEVPDEITVDYVQRVMDALDESWGAMFRQYQADGGPTVDNLAWLAELYAEPAYQRFEHLLGQVAANDFEDVAEGPTQPTTEDLQIISAESRCIFFSATRSYRGIFGDESAPESEVALLQLVVHTSPDGSRNTTIWQIRREVTSAPDDVEDPCVAGI
jgi:hypothetical protein